jgi:STE24 endopeptidase
MNIYAWIVLLTLLFEAVLNFIADQLNLRALKPQLPAEFQGVYDEIAYARSQDYTRVKTRFGLVVSTLELLFLLAFWFAGGFGWLASRCALLPCIPSSPV